jgi:precorrin-6B methylase 2
LIENYKKAFIAAIQNLKIFFVLNYMNIENSHILAPFAPTDSIVAWFMLMLAEPQKDGVLLDIGCGEGAIIREAAKSIYSFKKIFGVEYDDDRFKKVIHNVKDLGLEDKVEIIHDDALKIDFSKIDPDVVTMYLTPLGVSKLKPKLESELKRDSIVISNSYEVEGWKPSNAITVTLKYSTRHGHDFYRENDIYVYKIGETRKKLNMLTLI